VRGEGLRRTCVEDLGVSRVEGVMVLERERGKGGDWTGSVEVKRLRGKVVVLGWSKWDKD